MRRIMIARRNNVKDHEVLKKARRRQHEKRKVTVNNSRKKSSASMSLNSSPRVEDCNPTHIPSLDSNDCGVVVLADLSSFDESIEFFETKIEGNEPIATEIKIEDITIPADIDYEAVIATRSYRKWNSLPEGFEFTYNHRFIKGRAGHDDLLIKNIWRRMKYRRDNKDLVIQFKNEDREDIVAGPKYDTENQESFYPLVSIASSVEAMTGKSTSSPLSETMNADESEAIDSSLSYLENLEHFIKQGTKMKEEPEVDFHGITILGV